MQVRHSLFSDMNGPPSLSMKKLFLAVSTLLLLGFTACTSSYEPSEANIERIQTATLDTWDGRTVRLDDFEGEVVVIDFWETWCAPCLEAFPDLQRALDEHPDALTVIAATPGWEDTEDDVRAFRDKHDYDFVFVEASGLADDLGFNAIPLTLVFDRNGEFLDAKSGTSGDEYEWLMERVAEGT